MNPLIDPFQRSITYLRISVTDRCNLRCVYCMPAEGLKWLPREDLLSYEEIHRVVEAAAELGLKQVRITGGEPTVRAQLPVLIQMLASVKGIEDIALSTNGLALARMARELKEAGLHRVNVSLDTLDPQKFHAITRLGSVEDVFAGIRAAQEVGLKPVKINAVLMKGVNEEDLSDMAALSIEQELHVRFIELMPFMDAHCSLGMGVKPQFLPYREAMKLIQVLGPLEPAEPPVGNGPARYYRLPGAKGTVGFISPLTQEHFCAGCNRLRLTAEGKLRPCLLTDLEVDLRPALRRGASKEEIQALFFETLRIKPESHGLAWGRKPKARFMVQIGG